MVAPLALGNFGLPVHYYPPSLEAADFGCRQVSGCVGKRLTSADRIQWLNYPCFGAALFERAPFLIGDRNELDRKTHRLDLGGNCSHPISHVDHQLHCSTSSRAANSNRGRGSLCSTYASNKRGTGNQKHFLNLSRRWLVR